MRFNRLHNIFRLLAAVLLGGILASSCQEHEYFPDYTLRVGNIYCQDGRIIPPEVFDDKHDEPIGVIVALGATEGALTYKAIAVGLDEWQAAISSRNQVFDGVGSGIDDMQGRSNTASMLMAAMEDSTLSCPAAEYTTRFGKGDGSWYIPACGELRHLSRVKETVLASFRLVGAKPLTDQWYVSSSQDDTSEATTELYNLNVSMSEGRVMSSGKTSVKIVRPFIVIQ